MGELRHVCACMTYGCRCMKEVDSADKICADCSQGKHKYERR